MNRHSFRKGWVQVRQVDGPHVKERIMNTLSITSRSAWNKRLKGEIEPTEVQRLGIEAIFHQYGVRDVWGK